MAQTLQVQLSVERRACADALASLAARVLLAGLIVGIFTLARPVLVLAALGGCLATFICLACLRSVPHIGLIVLVNFGYWLASGFLSGGLPSDSLTSSAFWRGEGRCFLFYLPLLSICVMRLHETDIRFVVKVVCVLTALGVVLCVAWLAGLGHLFQSSIDAESGERSTSTYFIGLQTSHTGAGAFWTTVTAFLAAYSVRSGERRVQFLAILGAMLTLGTGGRAAILGLVAAVAWIAGRSGSLSRSTIRFALPIVLLLFAGGWAVLAVVPDVTERVGELFESRTLKAVAHTIEEPTFRNPSGYFFSGAALEHHNLVIRVKLWKYALDHFLTSPILGIGYGRFNDTRLDLHGIPWLGQFALGGEVCVSSNIRWEMEQLMTSTGNAHNSYLHILAETGIVGLGLFLYLWYLLYRCCSADSSTVSRSGGVFPTAYCDGCRAAIVSLLFTSLAGHALAAPSGGIVLMTLIGAWIGQKRTTN